MRPLLLLLWGCLLLPGSEALTGPQKVRGFEGGAVSLQCTYSERLRANRKYWCRRAGLVFHLCSGTVYAREDGQQRTEGRVSIQDHRQELTLNVTLRELTLQDSGEYLCGITILGPDETFVVSLLVLPASAPGVHPAVTAQGKTEAEAQASPFAGPSPSEPAGPSLYTGTSPYAGTPPGEGHPPHRATSPHAGTSQPPTYLAVPSGKDTKPRASYSKARVLAPVLVLLFLLLATGLAVVGRCLLRGREEGGLLDTESEKNKKVHLSHVSRLAPEYAVVNLAAPAGPRAGPQAPSASPYAEIQEVRGHGQTPEEEEAASRDPAGKANPGPPFHVSEEELRSSVFVPV